MAKAKQGSVSSNDGVKEVKARSFVGIWYPDDPSHVAALSHMIQNYKCAYILHDKDEDENGELKKPHWHVVFNIGSSSPRYASGMAKEFQIESNYIQTCKNLNGALRYLIHNDDPDKYQYDIDDVKGDLKQRLKENMVNLEESEGERVVNLLDYIESRTEILTTQELSRYCAVNGYWDVFRRSGAIFLKCMEEQNEKIRRQNKLAGVNRQSMCVQIIFNQLCNFVHAINISSKITNIKATISV